ncbi:OPT2 [[Candida] subhashii]|uniref:OPT2 n=1 Tax=[Candida] subhashii TaxID=561895 RepID=A0A8J5QHS0_9ASCO|nr:OPT2 [[Candida] subhashii]KAG7663267.1 OPT2 [[Candida] subhashii]
MSSEIKEEKSVGQVTVTSVPNPELNGSHEVDLQAITSNPLSIGEVAASLTLDQKTFILKRFHFDTLLSFDKLPPQASFMFEKIEQMTSDQAFEILKEGVTEHDGDINVPDEDETLWKALVAHPNATNIKTESVESLPSSKSIEGNIYEAEYHQIIDWDLQVRLEAAMLHYWSPYPEVRSVCDPFDDPTIPVETVRVYIIGILWTAVGAVINMFFNNRQPSITLSVAVVQILLYPSGLLMEYILPKWDFKVFGQTVSLNPGPYTFKEQMLATIFIGVSGGSASYATSNIMVQKMKMFYNNQWVDFGYQILLVLATNFLGFGLAGIMRKFAVYPVKALWPSILPNIAMNRALMSPELKQSINGWVVSRYRFFFIVFAGSFAYFWVVNYLFQALSVFNWLTWISPQNLNLAVVTGTLGGLGLNPIPSFDWNVISYSSPLVLPFYNQAATMVGMGIGFICILGVWYSNYKWTGFLPINSNGLFTNTGEPYMVTSVVNENSLLDQKKYQSYGPPFSSAANLVVYGAFFAIYPFHIVYECTMNHKQMWDAMKSLGKTIRNFRRSTFEGHDDPHTQMMKAYPEVPEWAFLIVLLFSILFAILCVKLYPAETPVWGIFFAIAINFIFLIPITTVYARSGFSFGLNIVVELMVGYMIPNNGLALNFIKALGYNIDAQAQNFVNDLKQGHYAKIPPRSLFRCQLLSVFITSFVQLAVLNFQIENVADFCEPTNEQKFTCPGTRTFYSASIMWGVIGPKKMFTGLYPILQWCFLIGFLLAFPCIAFKKYGPRKLAKSFEPSIIIGGMLNYSPYNLSYFIGGFYASFAFMHYIKKRYEAWWQKYNYILTCALSAGVAFSSIIIFFAVFYKEKDLNWWGNTVPFVGIDASMTGRLNATESAPDGYFGPRIGHFP